MHLTPVLFLSTLIPQCSLNDPTFMRYHTAGHTFNSTVIICFHWTYLCCRVCDVHACRSPWSVTSRFLQRPQISEVSMQWHHTVNHGPYPPWPFVYRTPLSPTFRVNVKGWWRKTAEQFWEVNNHLCRKDTLIPYRELIPVDWSLQLKSYSEIEKTGLSGGEGESGCQRHFCCKDYEEK